MLDATGGTIEPKTRTSVVLADSEARATTSVHATFNLGYLAKRRLARCDEV
jgi:hypothetical protein